MYVNDISSKENRTIFVPAEKRHRKRNILGEMELERPEMHIILVFERFITQFMLITYPRIHVSSVNKSKADYVETRDNSFDRIIC